MKRLFLSRIGKEKDYEDIPDIAFDLQKSNDNYYISSIPTTSNSLIVLILL